MLASHRRESTSQLRNEGMILRYRLSVVFTTPCETCTRGASVSLQAHIRSTRISKGITPCPSQIQNETLQLVTGLSIIEPYALTLIQHRHFMAISTNWTEYASSSRICFWASFDPGPLCCRSISVGANLRFGGFFFAWLKVIDPAKIPPGDHPPAYLTKPAKGIGTCGV